MIERLLPLPVPPEIRNIAAQFAQDFAATAAPQNGCPFCAPALYLQLAAAPLCLIDRDTILMLYAISCAVQSDADRMWRQWAILANWLQAVIMADQVLHTNLAARFDVLTSTRQ